MFNMLRITACVYVFRNDEIATCKIFMIALSVKAISDAKWDGNHKDLWIYL